MAAQSPDHSPMTIGQLATVDAFPGESVGFSHDLHLDDRLTYSAVADLADRLPRRSVIADTAAQPLLVPKGGPPRGVLERPGDVIRDLHNANAWLTLLNVEDDPGMAEVMNSELDKLESGMMARWGKRGKMYKRVAFVFVSSPNSVTPVHFDIEHSLLMQVRGSKKVSIGRWATDADRRHEFDRYWDCSQGRIEAVPPEETSYTVTPGQAVYIPPGKPHWVQNGPDTSLSVTLTYFTAATVRENRIEDFNAHLRRRGMHPREPGRSAAVDTVKICAMGGWALGQRLRSVVPGSRGHDSVAQAGEAGHRVEGS
jgi:mannose-6-phosphate isomerase-like protein (cupin superfamily)